MKNLKKIVALLLALVMIVGLLAACGKDPGANTPAPGGNSEQPGGNTDPGYQTRDVGGLKLPLCEKKEELTVWLVYSGTVVSDLNDIEGVKEMEKNTNVHINWIPIEQDTIMEQYSLLIASGKYPDIIYSNMVYPGGFQKGVDDGVIHPDMDKLIRENMPNYLALLASSEQASREAKTDDGRMLVASTLVGQDLTAESEGTYQGLAYRADILEKLGMDVPTTVDEWYEVLKAAKAYGVEAPFNLDQNGGSYMSLAWNVCTGDDEGYLQMDGDKVTMGVLSDGFKGYLDTMRKWYSEGLINPNFTSFHYFLDTPGSVENNQIFLYTRVLSAFSGSNYFNFHMSGNAEAFLQPVVSPVLKEGDKPIQLGGRIIAKEGAYITTDCKNPELAAKWLDYQFSLEGQYLNWYGVPGVTFTVAEDGTAQFTDLVWNNDSGMATTDFLQKYALNWGNSWLGKHNVSASWKISAGPENAFNQELAAVAIWSEPETNIYVTKSIALTEEEGDEANPKLTAIKTAVAEYMVNYIIGQDVAPFEQFVSDLYAMGAQDVLDIYQAAYDRYLAR